MGLLWGWQMARGFNGFKLYLSTKRRLVATHQAQAARRLVPVVGPRGQKGSRLELFKLEDAVYRWVHRVLTCCRVGGP
jgi:hypothetical protein